MMAAILPLDPRAVTRIIDANIAEEVALSADQSTFVAVGDAIDVSGQEAVLRGHGTLQKGAHLVASLCGRVERVNQLVTVRALRRRYAAEVGDVVLGRVAEVSGRRWVLDVGGRGEGVLQLSAVELPGGAQRRRTAEDELGMRAVFAEGDLLVAEVQALHADGSVALHTRAERYGRVGGGSLVKVPQELVRRQRRHFLSLPALKVDVILGCNGCVWVSAGGKEGLGPEGRLAVARVCQAVLALAQLGADINATVLPQAAELSEREGVAPSAMLSLSFLTLLATDIAAKRVEAMQVEA